MQKTYTLYIKYKILHFQIAGYIYRLDKCEVKNGKEKLDNLINTYSSSNSISFQFIYSHIMTDQIIIMSISFFFSFVFLFNLLEQLEQQSIKM